MKRFFTIRWALGFIFFVAVFGVPSLMAAEEKVQFQIEGCHT